LSAHEIDTVLEWRGSTVVDRDGDKIGKFEELYLDHADRPAWAAVTTGLFGMRQSLVPLADAAQVEDGLQVPFDKDRVKSAPNFDPDAQLTEDEELELYRHYGLAEEEDDDGGDREPDARADDGGDREPDARTDDDAQRREPDDHDEYDEQPGGDTPDAMTRSEEELVVGRRRRVRGRARLKKYVVTEHVQKTVPVQREEVRVEYDPASEGEDRSRGADAS
jgi:stress response protein YsnF